MMIVTASVLAIACIVGLFVSLRVRREARRDQQWQHDHGGGELTRQSAANYVRREHVRCIKLALFTVAAIVSVVTTPAHSSRAPWASHVINACLIGVVALLIEGAFRSQWERERFMAIEAEEMRQRQRRSTDVNPLPIVIAEQIDKELPR
jgi:anaerobic C4-dicarboxylate transporter